MAAFDSDPLVLGAPRVAVAGLTLAQAGSPAAILEDVDLQIQPGECVLLEGKTGSGKSTLLRAIAGLAGIERRAGSITTSGSVALLMQSVETQLLCPSVGEEVALGLRDPEPSAEEKQARVRCALASVGLQGSQDLEVDRLSAGQKQRVVIAALLAREPTTLMLDEPFSALDPSARHALVEVIARLKRSGTALLVAEHAAGELTSVADRRVRIDGCRLRGGEARACESIPGPRCTAAVTMDPPEHLDDLPPGGRVLLTGPNASGKSTLLRMLASQAPRRGNVAMVIQEPRRSLFERTVSREVAFSFDRLAGPPQDRDARIEALLERFELRACAERSPRRLSYGQQHRLAIAAALAGSPAFLLLDEPFAGLDPSTRRSLLLALEDEQTQRGTSIVIASHDREPLDTWCGRVASLEKWGG